METVESMIVHWHEKLMDKVKRRHAENVSVWNETSGENVGSLISGVKLPGPNSIKMSLEQNVILTHLKEHLCALRTLATETWNGI